MAISKNPAIELKRKREKQKKDIEKEAKVRALGERELEKKRIKKEEMENVRRQRLARDAAELLERQAEYKERRAELEREQAAGQKRAHDDAAAELLRASNRKDESPTQRPMKRHAPPPSRGRVEPKTASTPAPKIVSGPSAPTLDIMTASPEYEVDVIDLPDLSLVTSLATMRVFCADTPSGVGMWGDGAGDWAKPEGWRNLIENLNQSYTINGECDDSIVMGEYNAVFLCQLKRHCTRIPEFFYPSGEKVSEDGVVFRVTRPDAQTETDDGTVRYRYKTLCDQAHELYYSLQGAAQGYAIPVFAAMLFQGPRVRRNGKTIQLYGSLYVLKKAPTNLNTVFDNTIKHLKINRKLAMGTAEMDCAIQKCSRRLALRVLPVLVKQSRLGGLNFDCKPANTLFEGNATVYMADFDAAMFSIIRDDDSMWQAHLLMALLLLSTHIRVYHSKPVADGWAAALRPLLLDLVVKSRGAKWLHDARVTHCDFLPSCVKTPAEATLRLEMMISAYFLDEDRSRYFRAKPQFRADNTPLVHQMLRFVLHGDGSGASAMASDSELEFALGRRVVAAA